jgi:hypothetical protein
MFGKMNFDDLQSRNDYDRWRAYGKCCAGSAHNILQISGTNYCRQFPCRTACGVMIGTASYAQAPIVYKELAGVQQLPVVC